MTNAAIAEMGSPVQVEAKPAVQTPKNNPDINKFRDGKVDPRKFLSNFREKGRQLFSRNKDKSVSADVQEDNFKLNEAENAQIQELDKNLTLVENALRMLKAAASWTSENKMEIAKVAIPTLLGTLAMIGNLPIPSEVLARMALSTAGGIVSNEKAAHSSRFKRFKLLATVAGAIGGATSLNAVSYIPAGEVIAGLADDVPVAAAAGKAVFKGISRVARR